jgi:hypothetical protein
MFIGMCFSEAVPVVFFAQGAEEVLGGCVKS